MGNYDDVETEFVVRTLRLIDQYNDILDTYKFGEQYNYTLTVNCLLGLIVMPQERVVAFVPTDRLTKEFLGQIGSPSLEVAARITTLRALIQALRNSAAHFDIKFISDDAQNLMDWIEFNDTRNGRGLVAKFRTKELLPFLRYYSECLLRNIRMHRP